MVERSSELATYLGKCLVLSELRFAVSIPLNSQYTDKAIRSAMLDACALDQLLRGIPRSLRRFEILCRLYERDAHWQTIAIRAVQWSILSRQIAHLEIKDVVTLRFIVMCGERHAAWTNNASKPIRCQAAELCGPEQSHSPAI